MSSCKPSGVFGGGSSENIGGECGCPGVPVHALDSSGNPVLVNAVCDQGGCDYYDPATGEAWGLGQDFFLPQGDNDTGLLSATSLGSGSVIPVSYTCTPEGVCTYFDASGNQIMPGVDFELIPQPQSGASAFPGYDPNDPAKTFTVQAYFDGNTNQWVYTDSTGTALTEGVDFIAGEPCCHSFMAVDPATGDPVQVNATCHPSGICSYADVLGNPVTPGIEFEVISGRQSKGSESVPFDGTGPTSLSVPSGANHAEFSVWGANAIFTFDGTPPDPQSFIGSVSPCFSTGEIEGRQELQNTQVTAEPDQSGTLWVEYFCVPPVAMANG